MSGYDEVCAATATESFKSLNVHHVCRREAVGGPVRFSDLHRRLAPQKAAAGLRLRRQGGQIRQQPGSRHRQAVRPSQ